MMFCSTSCLLSPPIAPEPPEVNQPPFILPSDPETEVVAVTTPTVTFRARLFDENPDEVLDYVWLGEKSDIHVISRSQFLPAEELFQGIFYRYEDAQNLTLDTCTSRLRNAETETIWLYVADRQIEIDGTEISTGEEGYLDSWAWVLRLQPGRCG